MDIQIDTREKPQAIKLILEEFDRQNVHYYRSKLYTGDYMSLDNPRLIIDRKQDIEEIHQNVCQGHERFKRELLRAKDAGIQLIFLIEHGEGICRLEDLLFYYRPEQTRYKWTSKNVGGTIKKMRVPYTQKAISGQTLYKSFRTIQDRYGADFAFCDKEGTGKKIIELLS